MYVSPSCKWKVNISFLYNSKFCHVHRQLNLYHIIYTFKLLFINNTAFSNHIYIFITKRAQKIYILFAHVGRYKGKKTKWYRFYRLSKTWTSTEFSDVASSSAYPEIFSSNFPLQRLTPYWLVPMKPAFRWNMRMPVLSRSASIQIKWGRKQSTITPIERVRLTGRIDMSDSCK